LTARTVFATHRRVILDTALADPAPAASTDSEAPRLEVTGLAVMRGEFVVFAGLSFTTQAGEVIALTGPNGSGKTTLLRALAGLARPAAGAVHWHHPGARPDTEGAFMHFLGHRDQIKPALTARAHLVFAASIAGDRAPPDPAALLQAVGIGRLADIPTSVMSAGQRRRLGLARLMAAPRPVWLLDEPTAALDTRGRALVADLLERHRRAGGLAICATHEDLGIGGVRRVELPERAP
jgi:heme exporter protein A